MEIKNNDNRLLSEINVTPFVDVMLVLLVIFMVTAPMMQAGFEVDLPKVKASTMQTTEQPLIVSIAKDKMIKIHTFEVTLERLAPSSNSFTKIGGTKRFILRPTKAFHTGTSWQSWRKSKMQDSKK